MIIKLKKDRTINEVWQEFAAAYPFLTLDFYKYVQGRLGSSVRQKLMKTVSLDGAGIRREGEVEVIETMTVRELEQNFLNQFGLSVQVSRKSGSIWLETTISDSWTLKQQNDHGKELSEPVKKDVRRDPIGSE